MNDLPYSEIREETDVHVVNTLVHAGWMLLEIYRRKRETYRGSGEYEEYPVYIMGNAEGG